MSAKDYSSSRAELVSVILQYLAVTGYLERLDEWKRQMKVVNGHLVQASVEIGAISPKEAQGESYGFLQLVTLILSHWLNLASGARRTRK